MNIKGVDDVMESLSKKMEPKLKLCMNCKYMKVGFFERILTGKIYALCCNPLLPYNKRNHGENLISGKNAGGLYCSIARQDNIDECGIEAKFFEEK